MLKIKLINVGYNVEDETINFGRRNTAINEKNLFEVSTVASIDVNQAIKDIPINGITLTKGLAIGFGNIFLLFTNESCSEVKYSHEFDQFIDTFHITNDFYSLICLRNGDVYLIQPDTNKIKIFHSLPRDSNNERQEKLFCNSYINPHQGLLHIVFTTTLGQIYCSSVQAKQFFEESDEQIPPKLICDKKFIGSTICYQSNTLKIFHSQKSIIQVWENDSISCEICLGFDLLDIIKMQYSHITRKLICLLSDNSLIAICTHSYIISNIYKEFPVNDFNIVNCSNPTSESLLNILYKNDDKIFFESKLYPEMVSKFIIQVNDSTKLISIPSINEEITFLENSKNTLFVKLVSETKPSDRYERFLKRKSFSEANSFASIYQLDKNLLYSAQIQDLITQIHIAQDSSDSIIFESLFSIFEKITDNKIILNFFRSPPTIKIEYMKRLLIYAKNKVETFEEPDKLIVIHLLLYLESFSLIYSNKSNVHWIHFFSTDIFESYMEFLNKGEMDNAILLWDRHRNELEKRLNFYYVDDILKALPVNLDLHLFFKWFRHFFLISLRIIPNSINNIFKWLIKKIKSLEMKSEKWPENIILFNEKLVDYFNLLRTQIEKEELNELNLHHSHYLFFINNVYYDNLILISEACKEILLLKQKFQIRIFLEQYIHEDKSLVVKHILDHYHPEMTSYLLENFLNNFMFKNRLNADEILSEIIIDKTSDANFLILSPDELESNILSLIYCIKNLESFINCAAMILDNVAIPWCAQIEKLYDYTKKLKHPKAQEIINQKKNMQIKLIYKKYGIRLVKCQTARFHKDNIDRLIYLNANLNEILQLVQGSEDVNVCYYKYINHLIKQGEITKAFEIFEKLQPTISIKICLKFINKTIFDVNHPLIDSTESSFIAESLFKFKYFLIKQNQYKYQQYIDIIDDLNNVFTLKTGFDISVRFFDYKNDRIKIFHENIDNFLNKENNVIYDIKRFSNLLKFYSFEIILNLVRYLNIKENLLINFEIIEWIIDSYLVNKTLDVDFLKFIKNIFIGNLIYEEEKHISPFAFTTWSAFPENTFVKWLDYANIFDIIEKFNFDINNTRQIIKTVLNRPTLNMIYQGGNIDSESQNNLQTYIRKTLSSKYCIEHLQDSSSEININIMIDLLTNLKNSDANILKITYIFHNYYRTILPNRNNSDSLKKNSQYFFNTNFILSILNNVAKEKLIDQTLSLSLLSSISQEDSLLWLNTKLQDNKLNISLNAQITTLGILYCNLQNLETNSKNLKDNLKVYYWKKIFYKYSLLNDEISFKKPEEMLLILLKGKFFKNFPQVKLYCQNFHLNFDSIMLSYLQYILLSWKPEIKVETDDSGKSKYSLTNNINDIFTKCINITSEMEKVSNVTDKLLDILKRANYYYYEIFICVEKLLRYFNYTGVFKIFQLVFLLNYQRISSPDDSELEIWFKSYPETTAMDPISKWRLPLYPFYQKNLKLIHNEFSLENYSHWCKYTKNLDIEKNIICGMAIKNAFEDYTPIRYEWLIFNNSKYLLEQISECIDQMTDFKFACAALYNVINKIQPGKDQVDASFKCYQTAKRWAETCLDQNNEDLRLFSDKIKKKYMISATKHILYFHHFDNLKYFENVYNGEALIKDLYDDPSILNDNLNKQNPNINKAAEEIAKLYKLNLPKIQFHIIRSNLFSLDDNKQFALQEHIKKENIKRIAYILRSTCSSNVISEMIDLSLDGNDISLLLRYHIWKALIGYINIHSIYTQKLSFSNIKGLENLISDLYFLNKFHSVDINFSLEYFKKNKFEIKLFNQVMKVHSKNKRVLSYFADMCLFNKEFGKQYWDVLLAKMLKMKMFNKLKQLLPLLHEKSIVSCCSTLRAWQYVITCPFYKVNNVELEDQEIDDCMNLIKLCPFICWIDFEPIIVVINKKKLETFASFLKPFVKESQQITLKEIIPSESKQ